MNIIHSSSISVLESAKAIAAGSRHVTISSEGVNSVATKLSELEENAIGLGEPEGSPSLLEPVGLSGDEDLLNWIFFLDTLNFCFWSDEPTLFTVRYRNKFWTGYRALEAAASRAIEAGTPLHRPSYFGHMSLAQLEEVFRSETHVPIPLLEQRLHCLHEVASVLQEHCGGKVSRLVEICDKDAVRLAHQLAASFPCFRDQATYDGQTVVFLKRAQIFPADLWNRFGGTRYGEFRNIGDLTMFADYRVPQTLQYFGVLHYSKQLLSRLRDGVELPQGCTEEVEIRGCSIWAVEASRPC
ncbi:Queuosine salvage protein [Geodia barretti]|uniref:Queuosine 5'-phosphate N-glycosylase/hydrolase n=1 Tax=Geodia barretti TaxID=519541 RepID=A0AA35XGH6_GEOBA|nr:Queuosine salvage protein [Geodia barretti]